MIFNPAIVQQGGGAVTFEQGDVTASLSRFTITFEHKPIVVFVSGGEFTGSGTQCANFFLFYGQQRSATCYSSASNSYSSITAEWGEKSVEVNSSRSIGTNVRYFAICEAD